MSQIRYKAAAAIGGAVRAEAVRRGHSLASLAPVLGLSKNAVYTRARGNQTFDYGDLVLIAEHLGMTVHQLIESAEVSA